MKLIVKVGTSSLTDDHGRIAVGTVEMLAAQLAGLRTGGHQVIVVSSGAVSAGLPPLAGMLGLGGRRPTDLPTLQAVAAVGQPRLMAAWDAALAAHRLVPGQVLLAPLDFVHRQQYLHARQTLERLLELGVMPIVNENDAVADDELRFGDNDRLAALVAHLVRAELLILLTDTAGLLTADPRRTPPPTWRPCPPSRVRCPRRWPPAPGRRRPPGPPRSGWRRRPGGGRR